MKLKWGIMGCGNIVKRSMGKAFTEAENAELVAVCDTDVSRAQGAAEKYGVDFFYGSPEELLENKDVKAVYVATPVFLHEKHTVMAAQSGRHVLCEKPMAVNTNQCQAMIDACSKNEVKLMIGFMMRFHSCHRKAKQLIENGDVGKLTMLRAQQSYWYPETPGAWQQRKSSAGGGAMADAGIHCINLLRYLSGSEVTEVSAVTGNVLFNYDVEDTGIILLRFQNGCYGIVDSAFSIQDSSVEQRLEIYGSRGSILGTKTIGPFPAGELKICIDGEMSEFHSTMLNPYREEIEYFTKCILEDKDPAVNGQEGLKDTMVLEAAYQSVELGKTVKIGDYSHE